MYPTNPVLTQLLTEVRAGITGLLGYGDIATRTYRKARSIHTVELELLAEAADIHRGLIVSALGEDTETVEDWTQARALNLVVVVATYFSEVETLADEAAAGVGDLLYDATEALIRFPTGVLGLFMTALGQPGPVTPAEPETGNPWDLDVPEEPATPASLADRMLSVLSGAGCGNPACGWCLREEEPVAGDRCLTPGCTACGNYTEPDPAFDEAFGKAWDQVVLGKTPPVTKAEWTAARRTIVRAAAIQLATDPERTFAFTEVIDLLVALSDDLGNELFGEGN